MSAGCAWLRAATGSRWSSPGRGTLSRMADEIARFARVVDSLRAAAPPAAGGWTLAHAIAHCACSVECSMTGYPELRSALFRATIGPMVKRRFLRNARMAHDVTAEVAGAPVAPDVALATACDRAAAAVAAFARFEGELAPHLAYGRCTKDEYAALHWLHFADHLRAFSIEPVA
jgi:hypothetical protein